MRIPIENIYYLLCYAWNKLEEKEKVAVSIDDRTELLDLFANILIKGTRILLKRGIDKSYIESTSELSGIKGKLEVGQTLKTNLLSRQRTICSFDEFSSNILTNQILVSTIYRLRKVRGLDNQLKTELITLLHMLEGIERIELTPSVFKKVKLNRNNRFYGFILDVCQIVHENILPSEHKGAFAFSDFTRDDSKK
jgi:5-methylcytosine-specific restriction enzyme subunit McrC